MKDFIPEIIIAATIVTVLAIYIISGHVYKKKRLKLLARFRQARLKSLYCQDKLREYILKYNAQHDYFYENITYGEYLKKLNKKHSLFFSERNYKRVKHSPIMMNKNLKTLQEQEPWLREAEKKINALQEN